MKIITLQQIKTLLKSVDIIPLIEEGFIRYSNGDVVAPPPGELIFKDPPGDVHIKYGYTANDEYYLIKVASGFYDNPKLQLPSSNGLMLLFRQRTGELLTILLDEGYLTNYRTAAAGAIAAKYLAPKIVHRIGIIGSGTQARLQLELLQSTTHCRDVIVFGREPSNLLSFQTDMQQIGYRVKSTQSLEELTSTCNLIISTTPASTPILFADQIRKGTHITAVGADSPQKQELDQNLFGLTDVIVADSIAQCAERGEIAHAIRHNVIEATQVTELGNLISGKCIGRTSDKQITIADLTGLAVQDSQIAKAVYEAALKSEEYT